MLLAKGRSDAVNNVNFGLVMYWLAQIGLVSFFVEGLIATTPVCGRRPLNAILVDELE